MYICRCMCIHVCGYVDMNMHVFPVCAFVNVYMYTCGMYEACVCGVYACACVCVYVGGCVYVYICVHVWDICAHLCVCLRHEHGLCGCECIYLKVVMWVYLFFCLYWVVGGVPEMS